MCWAQTGACCQSIDEGQSIVKTNHKKNFIF